MEKTQLPQSQLHAVEGFLREWDPMGVATNKPALGDKYGKYAPIVLERLQAKSSVDALTDSLIFLTVCDMGLPPNIGPSRQTAEQLYAWWANQKNSEDPA